MKNNTSGENPIKPLEKVTVSLKVNGRDVEVTVPVHYTLLDILRYELAQTGTKEGCGMGECGACTVIMNDEIVAACLVLATAARGKAVQTIEGIRETPRGRQLIEAFVKHAAVQCGFCTPGMIVSAYSLISKYKVPTREQITEALSGNLCRCTGYVKIFDAINDAAAEIKKGEVA